METAGNEFAQSIDSLLKSAVYSGQSSEADSQGSEFGHVVETGDGNAADVVVVQRAERHKLNNERGEASMRRRRWDALTLTEPPASAEL